MTELEFWTQSVRALKRLRIKELTFGRPYSHFCDRCCAIGALSIHLSVRGAIDSLAAAWRTACISVLLKASLSGLGTDLIDANDSFMLGDDSPKARRARYKHVLAFCERKVSAVTR